MVGLKPGTLKNTHKQGYMTVTSKPNKQPNDLDPVRVYLWADPDQEGIYYDQPPGDLPGYRKPRKYTEEGRRRLELSIGEDVQVIRPGVMVSSNTADNSGAAQG